MESDSSCSMALVITVRDVIGDLQTILHLLQVSFMLLSL